MLYQFSCTAGTCGTEGRDWVLGAYSVQLVDKVHSLTSASTEKKQALLCTTKTRATSTKGKNKPVVRQTLVTPASLSKNKTKTATLYGKIFIIISRGSGIRCLYLNLLRNVGFPWVWDFPVVFEHTVECFSSWLLVAITAKTPPGTPETKTFNQR